MKIVMKNNTYKRPKRKKHDIIVQNWHCDKNEKQAGRKRKLIFGLSKESDFNDDFVTSFVSEEPELLCFMLK